MNGLIIDSMQFLINTIPILLQSVETSMFNLATTLSISSSLIYMRKKELLFPRYLCAVLLFICCILLANSCPIFTKKLLNLLAVAFLWFIVFSLETTKSDRLECSHFFPLLVAFKNFHVCLISFSY